jgi:glycogen synthase
VAPAGHQGLYLNVEPIADKVGGLDDTLLSLTDTLLRKKLTELGASFAPAGEEKKAAQALIKKQNLRGYQVRVQLAPGASEKQLKVEMLIMTYPEQALQGSWNVKASGAKPETLIKAMVPKVVDDAAGDLNWKSP